MRFLSYISIFLAYTFCLPLFSCEKENDWRLLFNGKDLNNWDKYLGPTFPGYEELYEKATVDNVFSIVEIDGIKVLRISGEVHGSIATKESFENYHLRLEFKWGDYVTNERNSGLLYHSFGDFGVSFNTWMSSVECQLMYGNLGDTYLMTENVVCESTVNESENGEYYYRPETIKMPFGQHLGRRLIRKMISSEYPLGEWNTVDLYCFGQTAVHVVNGETLLVNENISRIKNNSIEPLTTGKIQLQSEGAELFIKMIAIKPITHIPEAVIPTIASNEQTGKWGDQGDGTFRNPIIAADFSDPDPIRVGEDYYMVSSTFESSPGVTVLHSLDLVNWTILGGVFENMNKITPEFTWKHMNRYNSGVYAPTIRYHAGKFWVFVNLFTDGFFAATATDATGPWEVWQLKDKNGKPLKTLKWTDPCPFWDDDGNAYLGSSRPPGKHWYSYLFQMSPDGKQLLDADVDHMNLDDIVYQYPQGGTLISPHYSSEGNKIYKRNGYYYLVHIEFLGENAGTHIYRSRNIYGTHNDGTPGQPGNPGRYEKHRTDPSAYQTGNSYHQEIPGQGGFVDTPDGRWFWIGQHNRYNSDGRPPCLLPVTWIDDWPVIGVNIDETGYGKMTWQMTKPILSQNITMPHGSDDFSSSELLAFWSWNHYPRNDKWSLTDCPGNLRLYASQTADKTNNFFKVSNTLNQRHMRSDSTIVTIKVDITPMVEGQHAGLVHFNGGQDYAYLGVIMEQDRKSIIYKDMKTSLLGPVLPADQYDMYIRSVSFFNNELRYQYSLDGVKYFDFGDVYIQRCANFQGDMVGVFTFNNKEDKGYIDVDWFDYMVSNK